jgi:sarcosine oxidase gamma subunit
MQRELEPGQRLEDIEESIRAIAMRSNADMYSIVILRGFSMDSESFIAMLVNGEGEIVT